MEKAMYFGWFSYNVWYILKHFIGGTFCQAKTLKLGRVRTRVCGSKFFYGGHEEIKRITSCEISKFLLHKFQKDGGTGP